MRGRLAWVATGLVGTALLFSACGGSGTKPDGGAAGSAGSDASSTGQAGVGGGDGGTADGSTDLSGSGGNAGGGAAGAGGGAAGVGGGDGGTADGSTDLSGSGGNAGGGAGGAGGGAAGAGGGAAGAGGGAAGAGGAPCNTLTLSGNAIVPTAGSGTPPTPGGGPIADGTYRLTSIDTYNLADVGGIPDRETISIAGTHAQAVSESGQSISRLNYTISAGGNQLQLGFTCPADLIGASTVKFYTATPTTLLFFTPGKKLSTFYVSTYTKQ
jgi:hypothetical protein